MNQEELSESIRIVDEALQNALAVVAACRTHDDQGLAYTLGSIEIASLVEILRAMTVIVELAHQTDPEQSWEAFIGDVRERHDAAIGALRSQNDSPDDRGTR